MPIRKKSVLTDLSTSDSSPELNSTTKMANYDGPADPGGQVTQAWLTSMFNKHSAQISANVEKRILESEEKIKEHLNGKIKVLNEQINQLQADNERQGDRIELLEKTLKMKNIVITGPIANKEDVTAVIGRSLASAGEDPVKLVDLKQITTKNGMVKHIATCNTMEEKSKILRARKGMTFNGHKVFVDSDLTKEEQEIQFEARKFAKQQEEGAKVAVAYKKVWVNGKCFPYNKATKSFIGGKN